MASMDTTDADPSASRQGTSRLRRLARASLWLLPAVAVTAGFELTRPESIEAPPWWRFLFFQLTIWLPWAALSGLVARLRDRFPLSVVTPRAIRHGALHTALAIVIAFGLTAALTLFEFTLARRPIEAMRLMHLVLIAGHAMLLLHLLIYGALLVGFEIGAFRRRLRDRENQLQRARLDALQHQLQPHFLFNTLHAVSTLIDEDTDGAQAMVARLSDLLRASLREDQPLVPLRREIEIAEAYLAIEEVRFGDRLSVDWQIDDAVLDVAVPPLLLQPILENAVRFSVGTRSGSCQIEIVGRSQRDDLELEIRDDGVGPGAATAGPADAVAAAADGNGVGLDNTLARLRGLFGDAASLELRRRMDADGAVVRIRIPLNRRDGARRP